MGGAGAWLRLDPNHAMFTSLVELQECKLRLQKAPLQGIMGLRFIVEISAPMPYSPPWPTSTTAL